MDKEHGSLGYCWILMVVLGFFTLALVVLCVAALSEWVGGVL